MRVTADTTRHRRPRPFSCRSQPATRRSGPLADPSPHDATPLLMPQRPGSTCIHTPEPNRIQALFFGDFLLGQQKKVTRPTGGTGAASQSQPPQPSRAAANRSDPPGGKQAASRLLPPPRRPAFRDKRLHPLPEVATPVALRIKSSPSANSDKPTSATPPCSRSA